jgi:predicted DNA-binding protein
MTTTTLTARVSLQRSAQVRQIATDRGETMTDFLKDAIEAHLAKIAAQSEAANAKK